MKTVAQIRSEWEEKLLRVPLAELRTRSYRPPLHVGVMLTGIITYRGMLQGYDLWDAMEEAMRRTGWRISRVRLYYLLRYVEWIDDRGRPRFDLWRIRMRGRTYHTRNDPGRFRTAELEVLLPFPKYWEERQIGSRRMIEIYREMWAMCSESMWMGAYSPMLRRHIISLPEEVRERYGIPEEAWEEISYVGAEYVGNFDIGTLLTDYEISVRFNPRERRWEARVVANWDIYYPIAPWEETLLPEIMRELSPDIIERYIRRGEIRRWRYYGIIFIWIIPT